MGVFPINANLYMLSQVHKSISYYMHGGQRVTGEGNRGETEGRQQYST